MNIKTIGYLIFATFFYLFRFCKIKENKVFCIMTHDGSEDSSVGVVIQALEQTKKDYSFVYIKKNVVNTKKQKNVLGRMFAFFVVKPYHLATSEYVLQDNIFLPMAFLKFKKKVKVVQLWHGTGTIKKFGQSVNTGRLGRLEKNANRTITHLIVSSDYSKKIYQQAFGISVEKLFVLGLPRTDILFKEEKRSRDLSEFYRKYPELIDKKCVLYAPTFRDQEVDNPQIHLDIEMFLNGLSEEYVLLLRLHPHVADALKMEQLKQKNHKRLINVSSYSDLNTLLFVAQILVTDYSSIIYEYSILEKPMFFFAYDLDEFESTGRGFYEDYKSYVPGEVVYNTMGLIQAMEQARFDCERLKLFRENSFSYLDGQSTNRVLDEIF